MNVLVPVGSLVTGARIVLDALEVHHLRVRRAGAGEAIRLLDGAGGVGEGTLELGRKDAVVTVGTVHREAPPKDENEIKPIAGDVRWAGLEMQYFAMLAIPAQPRLHFHAHAGIERAQCLGQ